ncbi:glycosyltransferase family 1 protein [soil metagenome]
MKNPRFSHAFQVQAQLPEPLLPLNVLASNYRWTWDPETRNLFRFIDRELWHATNHNPVLFLNRLSREKLGELAADQSFVERLNEANTNLQKYLSDPTWFDEKYPGEREKTTIAYFCAEFGISESLPIYSGGLGVLAGDHLKAASDLGIPLVAVGLLYNRGYFRQRLTPDGWQQEIYPEYDFYQMPLTLIRNDQEEPLKIEVEFPDRTVNCHIWRAEVGRIQLYLLDSNVMENTPADQDITDTLYGGDEDMRIRQEMILGIGGMRALRAVGIDPTVCHMNEGHAAFLTVERIRQFVSDHQCDYATARQALRAGNVFTTHTPVPAGFDLFSRQMLERYLGKTLQQAGIPMDEFIRMGRNDPENEGENFNMALLAMSNSNHVNGVSKLHAAVTRSMFGGLWPNYPESEVPVSAVTNGIHTMTWISTPMADLFDRYLGDGWRRRSDEVKTWEGVEQIPDEELWNLCQTQRSELVRHVRHRQRNDDATVDALLDPGILTIGFARRFATYKRGSLMLRDRDRLKHLLFHAERPVQIVIAGKAHPKDDGGKKIIQDLVNFTHSEGVGARMVFLEDYDMRVARLMVQGVDLWLNNPRRPYEASGTSGMKVIANGALNCSILDGWWDEGFDPSVGWAIGDRENYPDEGYQDWLDSISLYQLLEDQITPTFYERNENGIPQRWLRMLKDSIKTLAPQFSTARMVSDYASQAYMPAASSFGRLLADNLGGAKNARDWKEKVRQNWGQVKILEVHDTSSVSNNVGVDFQVTARVNLGVLNAGDVKVQAVYGAIAPNRELTNTSVVDLHQTEAGDDGLKFQGTIVAASPGYQGYSIRIIPSNENVAIPVELGSVTWEG